MESSGVMSGRQSLNSHISEGKEEQLKGLCEILNILLKALSKR